VITHFIKPSEEQDLARCAVIFPLFVGLSLLVPLAAGSMLHFFFRALPMQWAFGMPFCAWLAWMFFSVLQVIRLIRNSSVRCVSPAIFHSIQAFAVIAFIADRLLYQDLTRFHLTIWLICMEFALFVFFIAYFLLAACTQTRIPWHAFTGFAIVCASLYFGLSDFNAPKRQSANPRFVVSRLS
jgi:hypothetical protein